MKISVSLESVTFHPENELESSSFKYSDYLECANHLSQHWTFRKLESNHFVINWTVQRLEDPITGEIIYVWSHVTPILRGG